VAKPDQIEKEKPAWAKREGSAIIEEVSGPPVEVGKEERDEAERLRQWWAETQNKENEGDKV
jgi:hypothetical protein